MSFLLDNKQSWNGSIGADWDIFGEKMIVDPTSTKPVDWVDEEFIRDPKATKPADWKEEPEKIADPKSVKPVDWDEEVDGKWEPMMIVNPKYKKWEPSLVSNPKYKGPWKAKKMLNPDYGNCIH